jgi:hypothetical protein
MSACTAYPRGHCGGTEEVGDTNLITSFSINGEHIPETFSERRGCVLRASVAVLMGSNSQGLRGRIKAHLQGKCLTIFSRPSPLRAWRGLFDHAWEVRPRKFAVWGSKTTHLGMCRVGYSF